MATYDAHKPFVIGDSFVPLLDESTVLDTGAEVGYRFVATQSLADPNNNVTWLRVVTDSPPPGTADRSEIVCRFYESDPLPTCTPLQQIIIPCTSGSGGSLGGGASTHQEAVENPSDPYYVRLTGASQTARFWFGTDLSTVAAAFSSSYLEIVDVSVLYVASGPYADSVGNTVSLGMERQAGPIKRYMDYLVTGPSSPTAVTEITRSRFGELCPFWDTGVNPNTEPMRGPWAYQGPNNVGLYALSGTTVPPDDDVAVFFETGAAASGDFDFHYVALQVTYRTNFALVGIGGMDLSGGSEVAEGLHTYRCPLMPSDYPWDYTGLGVSLFQMTKGLSYTVTVSRARSGSVALSSSVPIPLTMINTVRQNVPELTGVKITKPSAEGAIPTYAETTQLPAIVLYDISVDQWATDLIPANVNPAGHAYEQQMLQSVHDLGVYYVEQEISDDTAGTFVWATFYARASESVTGALYISQTDGAGTFLGPEGSIDYPTWLALPEITDGWRKIVVRLTPGAVLAGAGGVTHWQFWTSSDYMKKWDVLGATANHTTQASGASSGAVTGYGGETAVADFQGTNNYPLDMTLELAQEMTTVTGFAVSQATQSLTVVDEYCDRSIGNVPTGIVYNHLEWDLVLTAMVEGWGYYEIQRRDPTMDTDVWETIAEITNPYVGEMDDYEARVGDDFTASYRIRTVHTTGIEGPWSSTVTSAIAAPGVTGTGCDVGLLICTTNENPSANLAYVHLHAGDDSEQFEFVEAGQGSLEPLFQRDYQVALRPVERGGVTFTRSVLVNKAGIPTGTLDRGFTSLRDLAWDAVPYVCVRDELGNRWLSNITVPSGAVRRHDQGATHYQVAQLTIVEVVGEPYAHDAPTPYLGLSSTRNVRRYAEIASCAPLAVVDDVDIRVKFIPSRGEWGFFIVRNDEGSPQSWWGAGCWNGDGPITYFEVLGDDGFSYEEIDTFVPVYNQPVWIRFVYDHDNGGGFSEITFYSSLDGSAWTSYGTTVTGPAGLVPSGDPRFYINVLESTIVQEMIVIDTGAAATIMDPDFSAQDDDTTSFADGQGNTWLIEAW